MSEAEPLTSPTDSITNKPLPTEPQRPGTSGTELGLRANREKASSAYQRAQRAEAAYRAKRRATYARKDYEAAKEHFKNAAKNLKEGSKVRLPFFPQPNLVTELYSKIMVLLTWFDLSTR